MTESFSLKSETINSKLYQILKKQIICNELVPGSRLVIRGLCKRFKVSSTPIRDALHHLKAIGLIEDRENGYYVIHPTESDVEEIYEMRGILEPFALEQVFPLLNREYLLDLQENILVSNTERNFQNDMDFHNFISDNCRNLRMRRQLQILANQSFQIGYRLHSKTTGIHDEINEHLAVLDALLKRDVELAVDTLKQHLRNSKERIIKYCFS